MWGASRGSAGRASSVSPTRRDRASCRAARRTETPSPPPPHSRLRRERQEREEGLGASWKQAACCWTMEKTFGEPRRRQISLERLERDHGAGVDDSWDHLHSVADEVADIDIGFHVEFGQNVIVAGDRIDFGGNLRFRQRAGDLVGSPERTFYLDEEGLHPVTALVCRSLLQQLRRHGPSPSEPGTSTGRPWNRAAR